MYPLLLLQYTNALMTGWGTHLQSLTAAGVWSWEEKALYVSVLEMKAFQLALNAFNPRIVGELVILLSDNATVVAYPTVGKDK